MECFKNTSCAQLQYYACVHSWHEHINFFVIFGVHETLSIRTKWLLLPYLIYFQNKFSSIFILYYWTSCLATWNLHHQFSITKDVFMEKKKVLICSFTMQTSKKWHMKCVAPLWWQSIDVLLGLYLVTDALVV